MKKCFLVLLFLVLYPLYNSDAVDEPEGAHCAMCYDGGGRDWLVVTPIGMERVDSISGKITLAFAEYTTAADPTCGDYIANIAREGCSYATPPESLFNERPCLWLCGDSLNCKRWGYCDDPCNFWSHSYSTWTASYRLFGKGEFQIIFKNSLVFWRPFNFGDFAGTGIPKFTSTNFLNKDLSPIANGDIFDAMESVGLSVTATFDGSPSPYIVVKFISNVSQDTTGVEIQLSGNQGDLFIYSTILPPGIFGGIVGDPSHLPPSGATITAIPRATKCDGTVDPNVPVGQLTVADYSLYISQISFFDDFDIFRDDSTTAPPRVVPIIDPVWVTNGNINFPAAYRRDSTYNMSVVVNCDHLPMHDFAYKLRAVCEGNQHIARYSTREYVGHIAFSNLDTISGIRPVQNGQFPDYVGKDSLTFIWSANKSFLDGIQNYRRLNITGPHKIYFTFERPLIDTVNVIGLDKICTYAQGLNIDTVIAEMAVNGIYNEHWDYTPGDSIHFDPLYTLRNRRGQCGNYANLMTSLLRSIGLNANSAIIYNGAQLQGLNRWLFWVYSGDMEYYCLFSKYLTSCDGQSREWTFNYHAISQYSNLMCDGALGLCRPETSYAEWWRYYLHPRNLTPPYSHSEPPPFRPTLFVWNSYIPAFPKSVLPDSIHITPINFLHP